VAVKVNQRLHKYGIYTLAKWIWQTGNNNSAKQQNLEELTDKITQQTVFRNLHLLE
jgi:hypothetical protein